MEQTTRWQRSSCSSSSSSFSSTLSSWQPSWQPPGDHLRWPTSSRRRPSCCALPTMRSSLSTSTLARWRWVLVFVFFFVFVLSLYFPLLWWGFLVWGGCVRWWLGFAFSKGRYHDIKHWRLAAGRKARTFWCSCLTKLWRTRFLLWTKTYRIVWILLVNVLKGGEEHHRVRLHHGHQLPSLRVNQVISQTEVLTLYIQKKWPNDQLIDEIKRLVSLKGRSLGR